MSKSKRSRVGQRMKPRGEQPTMQNQEKPLSTSEGQPEGTSEPVSAVETVTETPSSLGGKLGPIPPVDPDLAELLRQSRENQVEEGEKVLTLQHNQMDTSKDFKPKGGPDLSPEAVQAAIDKDAKERHEHVADAVHAPVKPQEATTFIHASTGKGAADSGEFHATELIEIARVGRQPNGDLAVVITIPEEMVTSVEGFAETDGKKSVETWCSEFFIMMLESYCTPNKAR